MSKNDTKSLARKAMKPVKPPKTPPITERERIKTSLYLNEEAWIAFRKLTAYPRGRTSEIIEEFIIDYVELNGK